MELAMGRRPRDLPDPASMNPEQLTSTPTKQDLLNEEIQKLAMKTHLEVQQREDIRPYLLFWMWFETAVTRRMPQWLTTTLPVLDCLWLEKVKAHRWRRWETTPFSMATLSLKGGPASFHLLTIHTKLWQTRWGKGPHSRQPRSLHWNKLKETDQPTQPRGTCHSLPSPSLLGQGHRDAQTFVPKGLSEPSLSPPSSGAGAVNIHRTSTAKAVCKGDTCWMVILF